MSDHDAPIDLATDERSQADREAEWERAIAGQRSYLGASVVVFLLYWLFFLPGFIFNCLFLNAALKDARKAGRLPSGIGCLGIMFLIGMIPAFVFASCVGLVGSGAAVALADRSGAETSYSIRRVPSRSTPTPPPTSASSIDLGDSVAWSNLRMGRGYKLTAPVKMKNRNHGVFELPAGTVIVPREQTSGGLSYSYHATAFDWRGDLTAIGEIFGVTDNDPGVLPAEFPEWHFVPDYVVGHSFPMHRRFSDSEGWDWEKYPGQDPSDWAMIVELDRGAPIPRALIEVRRPNGGFVGRCWLLIPGVEEQMGASIRAGHKPPLPPE